MFGIKWRLDHLLLLLLVLLVGLLATLTFAADTGRGYRLFSLVHSVPLGDKVGHFCLYGALSFLVNLMLRAQVVRLGRFAALRGSLLVMVLVTLEECSQMLFPSRSFELADLAADAAGIWSAGKLAVWYLDRLGSSALSWLRLKPNAG